MTDIDILTTLDDSGFAGSSPQPSGESRSTPSTLGSDTGHSCPSLPDTRSRRGSNTSLTEEPRSAVERAMGRLQVKIAAFTLERRIVATAAREQWRIKHANSINSWTAGLLAERLRGLDERLELCISELRALGAASKLLQDTVDLPVDSSLLGGEPDSLQMTSGDVSVTAPACHVGGSGRVDAAVLLHLERRAHRETKRQLRELRKRHELLRDEVERLRETRASQLISALDQNPPKDAAREICRLQAALLQLERVRDELTAQNRTLKAKVADLAAITHDPSTTYQLDNHTNDINSNDNTNEQNRLRRKSTYKVVHNKSELAACELELSEAQRRLAAAERVVSAREVEVARREADVRSTDAKLHLELSRLSNEVTRVAAENSRLQEDCNRERVARKRCHSQLQALRGKVRVFCRVRPPAHVEDEPVITASDPFTLSVLAKPGSPASLRSAPTVTPPKDYCFDRVFLPDASQDKIFEETSELLGSVLDGYNVCICAYGQTGTGKTHTILGAPGAPGLAPRTFTRLFELAREAEARCDVRVSAYVLELYNDRLIDLLKPPDHSRDPVERLEIRRDREGVVWVQGASVVPVSDADSLHQLFQRAMSARHVGATRLNAASSRSHLLIGVRVEASNRLTGSVLRGKVSLLDLAGSERVSKSGAVDEQLREASSINKSLAALGDVISALATDQPFVPYRNSKLTMLLQDSLGGNAKTLMFVTVSPDATDLDETITSLTYATRVQQITNTAKRTSESREIARLKQLIERLKRGERIEAESPEISREERLSS